MPRTALALMVGGAWLCLVPAAHAGTVQALRGCVHRATAQLPRCIKLHGKENTGPCRTGILMEVTECASKLDAEQLHRKDAVRRKILFEACVQMHNEGTGQTAQQECDLAFPPVPK